jgi:hypothetical protein
MEMYPKPLIPHNEIHVDHPDEMVENEVKMNFVFEEEEDPEKTIIIVTWRRESFVSMTTSRLNFL